MPLKFLIDNQLPLALARFLGQQGWHRVHVGDYGNCRKDALIAQFEQNMPGAVQLLNSGVPVVELK